MRRRLNFIGDSVWFGDPPVPFDINFSDSFFPVLFLSSIYIFFIVS